jgi:tRNA threonylcarbamoyladenosine biosynthesis protein TsaB
MKDGSNSMRGSTRDALLLLGVDTCGPSGSVALGRLHGAGGAESLEILGQIELEGRNYSATLVAAVRDLLAGAGAGVGDLGAIVAINGPGSFTGVRVGLSAVKGLAEPFGLQVVAVSRLEVLAAKSGVSTSALDAHRGEIFLRLATRGEEAYELLAGAHDLAQIDPRPEGIVVCDDAAAALVAAAWPEAELVQEPAPTAADALAVASRRVASRRFVDLALLDGHYLRRSDAEIFGEPAGAARRK